MGSKIMKNPLLALLGVAALLCTAFVSAGPDLFHSKLTKDQEILHTLGRLTYGPRPGDLAAVQKIGLKKWIDRQLQPETIPERPILEAKLAPLVSLNMCNAELTEAYPPRQLIAAVAN